MSAIRCLARAAAVMVAAIGAAVVVTGPATAADASCQLSRLPNRVSAGGNGTPVVGQVRSSTRETLDVVQVRWRIRQSGLDPDEVALSGLNLQEDDGELRATEELRFVGPFGRAVSHTLRFLQGAPSGRATVTMQVLVREDDGFKDACSSRGTITVQGTRATPTASPVPLETGLADASAAPPATAAAALDAPSPAASDSDSSLWPLYLVGALLVAGGIGLVALLLLRRPREDRQTTYEPAYVAGYGGQYGAAPTPYDTRAYPPAVDPYPAVSDAPTAVFPPVVDDRPDAGGRQHRGF